MSKELPPGHLWVKISVHEHWLCSKCTWSQMELERVTAHLGAFSFRKARTLTRRGNPGRLSPRGRRPVHGFRKALPLLWPPKWSPNFLKGPWGALYTFPSWKPLLSNHYLLGGKPFWNPIIFVFLLNQHTPWDMIPNVNCDCLSGGNWRMETQNCLSVFSLWALLEDFFTYFLNHFLNPWLDPINFHNLISKQITSKK